MPFTQIAHFDELAGRADLFGGGIADRRAQLISALLIYAMIHRVRESVLERVAIRRPTQLDRIRLAALVHLDAAIAEGHQQNIDYGFMPVVRLVGEGEVVPFDVKHGLYERTFLRVF